MMPGNKIVTGCGALLVSALRDVVLIATALLSSAGNGLKLSIWSTAASNNHRCKAVRVMSLAK